MEFSFPSGRSLLLEVSYGCRKGKDLHNILHSLGHSSDKIVEFGDSLMYSSQLSIDAFLENRKDFLEIGKQAIAATLIIYEDPSKILSRSKDYMSSYEYLFPHLNLKNSLGAKNKATFITFNYDRSLEFFLFNAIKYSFNLSAEESISVLKTIPIIHFYGLLGNFNLEPNGRWYDTKITMDRIKLASDSISIIHEGNKQEDVNFSVQDTINEAEKICFLGFGFHPLNVQRLNLDGFYSSGKPIIASAYGIGNDERRRISTMFKNEMQLAEKNEKSLDVLKNYHVFD